MEQPNTVALTLTISFTMKNLYFFCLTVFIIGSAQAQERAKSLIGKYFWHDEAFIITCDIDGANDGEKIRVPIGQRFSVIEEIPDTEFVIIRIYDYSEEHNGQNFYKYNYTGTKSDYDTEKIKNAQNAQKYFKVSKETLSASATPYSNISGALTGGVISFPFKLRLQKNANDFSSAFNLGAAVGYKIPHKSYRKFTYSLLAAGSLTTINLDASSVQQNSDKLKETNNFSALSFALGALVEYERFQAGMFLGLDRLGKINNDTFLWRYHNKPWLSFGFGYSIFSVDKENSTAGGSN